MAAGNIKGITIEIGGDTKGLQDSLKDVNKESKKIQTELKEVESALKLDPSNVDLVNQKMDLLADAVNSSTTKLNALKEAQAQVEAQFKNGDIGEEQYRAFQRELSNTEASLRNYQTQMQSIQGEQDRFKQNQQSLQTYLNATGKSVDDLSSILGTKLTNAIKNGTATSDQLEMALNKIGRQAGHSGQDLEAFRNTLRNIDGNSSLEQINLDLMQIGTTAEKTEKDLSGLTDGLKDAALGISTALTGLGVGAGVAASQFDNAVGQIQAGLGATKAEAEALEKSARNVWKAGFGESLEEVSSGLIRVKQNMKEIDGSEVENVTKNALSLAKAFESDVNEVTRAANNLMVNFGISSQEAFDLLAYGAQNGLNFSNELFDNVAEYSGLFAELDFSANEYFDTLITGSKQGVYNLDYLNDVFKEFGIRIKDGSDATYDALSYLFRPDDFDDFMTNLEKGGAKTEEFMKLSAKIGKEYASELIADLKKGGKSMEDAYFAIEMNMGTTNQLLQGISDGSIRGVDAMQQVLGKIAALEDPMERAQMGVALFGTKWEDLEETAMLSMQGVDGQLEGLDANMQKVIEAQEQTFGQRWESFTRSAASSLEPLGKTLLDLAENWLPKVIAVVEKIATWFSDLSPVMQGVIVAIGGVVTAIGPLIATVGFLAPIISNVLALFGGGGAILGAFGTALSVLTGPVGLTIAGIATLGFGVFELSKKLGESSIELESWGEGISKSTATAVEGFMGISDSVGQELMNLKLTSSTVTNEMATEMTGKFNEMYTQITESAKTKHTEQLTSLQDLFLNSSALTSIEEQKIIENMQKSHEFELEVLAQKNSMVAEILKTAAEEKRDLTEKERQTIANINEQMKEDAIRTFSENEIEQKVLFEKMKDNASELSALQAAEVVKNAVKQKEKVIEEANTQYDDTIAQIIKMRDESGVISAEQAEKMIAEAKKSRDTTIAYAEEQHENIISEAKKQAEEHVEQVDWETGEVKTKWEAMKTSVSSKMKELGGNIKQDWSQAWTDTKTSVEGMKNNATAKFEEIRKSASDKFEETKKKIITPIENARDKVGEVINEIKGFFSNLSLKFPEIEMPRLPRFSLDGEFSLNPPSVPKLNVKWNALGGIFTKPTIFNTANAGLQGVGEAGAEAILPLNAKTLADIGKGIANEMNVGTPSTIDNSKSYSGHTTINVYGNNPSPSEIARKALQAERQRAMEWGVV